MPMKPSTYRGKKARIKADQPAPEGAFAPIFLQTKADGLGEPIIITCQKAEQRTGDQHIVEMSDQKQAVVEHVISGWHSQQ